MKNLTIFLVIALVAGAIAWFAKDSIMAWFGVAKDKVANGSSIRSVEDMQKKMTELKMRRDRINTSLARMRKDQKENIQYLKKNGINKVADAKDNPHAQMALKNIQAVNKSIKELEKQLPTFESAITKLDAAIAQAKREDFRESAGLTDEELMDIYAIEQELNDKLDINEDDIFLDAEIEAMLDENAESGESSSSLDADELNEILKESGSN